MQGIKAELLIMVFAGAVSSWHMGFEVVGTIISATVGAGGFSQTTQSM